MVRMSSLFKVLAMVAIMFGVSYNAEAQLLGGLAKAVKNKTQQSKQEKICGMPTADAKAGLVTFTVNGTAACTWNPATLEIAIKANLNGNKAGDVYKLDPNTGVFTSSNGESKGSINEDLNIQSPYLGALKIGVSNYRTTDGQSGVKYQVYKDGKRLGSLSAKDCSGFGGKTVMDGTCDGTVSLLLAGYVYYGLFFSEKECTKILLGYDPDLKFTTEQLEDKVVLKNAGTESEIMDYESSRPYAGFDREKYLELKNCKVVAVGLTSEWKETKHDHTTGSRYDGTTWKRRISYWVVYELTDGRNMVAFSTYIKKSGYESGIERANNGVHEITDWVRK